MEDGEGIRMKKIQLYRENSNENVCLCEGVESQDYEELCFCGEKCSISLTENVQSVGGKLFSNPQFPCVDLCEEKVPKPAKRQK
ncbi:MAG: hypothetical protein JRC87_06710 [Deltaproteobacteria bacterium]|nr:hypothetical protein [Deltaproteobacteria bacterium]MBW2659269.1 hypothetical protein [Deltaproteobacteria bacterium]